MKKPNKSAKNRLSFLFAIVIIISIALIARLGYLQLYKGEELKKGAIGQWTKGITIKSNRGIIYDRKGQKLAVSISASTVWANPMDIKIDEEERVAQELSRVLGLDQEEMQEIVSKDKRTERIKQWVSREEAKELRELDLPGIQIVDDNRRYYPYGNFASYILGFTDIDNNGQYGVESTFDQYLSGSPGKWIKTTDAPGRQLPFDGEKIYNPLDGLSLVLTLDETIQHFAEQAAEEALSLNQAKSISIIVMDPKTGDVLAMVAKPDYNPNEPRTAKDDAQRERWEGLEGEELRQEWFDSWRNVAINDIYEPGSTFKLITGAAALEENAVNLASPYYCSGVLNDIRGVTIKCHRAHHDQTFVDAMNNSCNTAFVNIGRSLGKESFYKYIKAFGFGQKSGIALNGEEAGLIPANVDSIRDSNLATMSYGYGVALTPIQLITAVSSFANGGNLMEPRIVKELVDEEGIIQKTFEPVVKRKVLSEKTAATMLQLMESVVNEGTGSNAYVPGYRVGGKTGTAQKLVNGVYMRGKYMASFVGMAPINDPEIAILVVVDEPSAGQYYGGAVAAPVASEIIERTLKYLEVEPQYTEKEKEGISEEIIVPDLTGMEIGDAGKILTDLGLRYTTEYIEITDKSLVINQYPAPHTEIREGAIVDLYLEKSQSSDLKMPYLVGKSKEEVIKTLDDLGLSYEFEGEGQAIDQNPLPGEKVESGVKIRVEFQ